MCKCMLILVPSGAPPPILIPYPPPHLILHSCSLLVELDMNINEDAWAVPPDGQLYITDL